LKFKDIEVEDIGFGIIQFENGCYAQINDSMITKPKKKNLNDLIELTVFGEKGSCYYEGPWPFSSLKWYGVESFKLKENMPTISDFGECINTYAKWILYNESFFNTIEESSKVLLLIKALYKSSISGKKERVEKL
jgi:predicted dehydrogenase